MAIRVENRYRGLRAPHKIKMAVSGCTRECAEAQGKDVGVIATEKGWNLYVCGNGGMKPRHAELLASDLDQETVVKLVDRFLMFYIRTADRLQRTSTWRENLEGGLDYLKQVIVEDKLGIGAELEADMQRVVDSYEDEWKNAVEDPAVRQRFRTFVNSEAVDANVVFMPERGQIRPATPDERKRVIPIAVRSA
jgi:nitrite reductase (NADH) large subunit